ncbi:hypothetical protein A2954_00065 [Candidatus Roizmanbacteria bacterium RIFCSPLOWO2_01_FULL_37_12]|uniref:Uncharacterized protein n=1 Tax=Candidatus Roizmanbacteria bacterium RIFCSPLOWO2_01_FULL_37_12 TaxID=1802056 RepID=A0A1F7IBE8_9BACT|nr:MAG: hypothetical protein A3D76_00390 [Candidatus Roizmanbacteria bacterium RIFCSPHIGHO2_02_FULL_37_9b]OGK40678.1 MAG: hypothetical protein A2954_00065 [Candidatus Roizmanbacteria bacterium RIFCSPLOWO2_01_FULL_37_12]
MIEGSEKQIINIPEIITIPNERAGLREINVADPIDVENMWQIEQSPGMLNLIDPDDPEDTISATKTELLEWIEDVKKDPSIKVYAVVATKLADPENHGEVDGWLRIDGHPGMKDSEEKRRYERITGAKLLPDEPIPYEIAYIKRPGSVGDLLSSGVRVACYKIAADDALVANTYKQTIGRFMGPRRIVFASATNTNKNSIRVLENAHFDCIKKNVIYKKGKPPVDNFFVLNWNNFHKKMEQKDSFFLARLKTMFPDKFNSKSKIITDNRFTPNLKAK